jgi:uncharacterized membrane protein YdjX (TVP38/TMEM64 family)
MNTFPSQPHRLRSLVILLVTVGVTLAFGVFISKDMARIQNWMRTAGWPGLGVAILLYALLGASPIPSEPLTLLVMTVAGPLIATLIATFGNYLAAMLEYSIGFRLGEVANFEQQKEHMPLGLGRFPVDSVWFLLLARSIPGIGPKFVSLSAGAYRVNLWRYTWTTILSNLWGAAFFAFGGYALLTGILRISGLR